MARRATSDPKLLSLKQAAERLGVHPGTLRRWADRGEIEVQLTPGGHRRFSVSEVARLARPQDPTPHMAPSVSKAIAEHAISHSRVGLQAHGEERWMSELDEEDREEKRLLGRRLVGLMMQYISEDDGQAEEILAEARIVGRIYAKSAKQSGLEMSEALKATMFFRDNLVESAILLPDSGQDRPRTKARLYRRINEFLNSVQLAVAETYEQVAT